MKTIQRERQNGFTMVEILMAATVIAALVTTAVVIIAQTRGGVKNVKLRSDVESLNSAVQVYLANGGSMEGVETVGAAIAKLKTKAGGTGAKAVVGLRGSMLDARYQAEMLSEREAASAAPRALWSADKKRFVYATSGAAGAKQFYLDGAVAGDDALEEARTTALSYSTKTDWVWDYADAGLEAATGVGEISTSASSSDGYVSLAPPAADRLQPPSFSIEGGLYNYFDFDLEVELQNLNPLGTSVIYYTLDDSRWQVYGGGSVIVAANQELQAYAVSIDPDHFEDSEFSAERYESTFTISGGAGGDFLNPEGSEGMVTNLGHGESGEYFSFGTAAGTPDPSWLLFNGASFSDVGTDESFLLGTLDYYNGTIRTGTQALGVGLSIDLNFVGSEQSLSFGYDFELVSTRNRERNTAEENADFVRVGDLYAAAPVDLGGVSYNLILEFGETTEGGFSSIDQFHVLEGESASGNLYGRLVEVIEDGEDDEG